MGADPFPGPLSPDVRDDPYPCYRWLLAERPVYHDPRAGYWALSRYSDVVAAARDHVVFSSAQGIGPARRRGQTMISTDPPDHTRLRRLVSQAFQPSVIERLAPRVERICHDLIDASAVARGSFDLMADLARPLPVIVIAELLGFDPERLADCIRWSDALVEAFSNPGSAPAQQAYARTRPAFLSYLATLGQQRLSAPQDDLISRLVRAREEHDALSAAEIGFTCELFLAAGNETTTSLIGNGALALAAYPDQLRAVIERPSLLPAVIEESVRFDAPVQTTFRTTTTAVTVAGTEIPAGATVALLWAAANHDPSVFAAPEMFIASRHPNPHVGFGHGLHYCLGAPLARLEASVVARVLSERFRRLEPDPGVPHTRNLSSAVVRRLRRLPMSFALM